MVSSEKMACRSTPTTCHDRMNIAAAAVIQRRVLFHQRQFGCRLADTVELMPEPGSLVLPLRGSCSIRVQLFEQALTDSRRRTIKLNGAVTQRDDTWKPLQRNLNLVQRD